MLPPGAVKPDYTGYCLSNVPTKILSIFGIKESRPTLPSDALGDVETAGVENVILLVCDGFQRPHHFRPDSYYSFARCSCLIYQPCCLVRYTVILFVRWLVLLQAGYSKLPYNLINYS